MSREVRRTIACKQLNYRLRSGSTQLTERTLIADGQIDGRNWSIVCYADRDLCSHHTTTRTYYLKVDISEYADAFKINDGYNYATIDDFRRDLDLRCINGSRSWFGVVNQSPGIWENGFNPNLWLQFTLGSYLNEESQIREALETGFDFEALDNSQALEIARSFIDRIKPMLQWLESTFKPGIPYHYWWGVETPPPPREPQW